MGASLRAKKGAIVMSICSRRSSVSELSTRGLRLAAAVLVAGIAAFIARPAAAAPLAADDAAMPAYNGFSWPNGSNGGTGFGAWTYGNSNSNGAQDGEFIGNSTTNGSGHADGINTSTSDGGTNTNAAFGFYANSSQQALVSRNFNTALTTGQSFDVNMDIGFINSGGDDGISLHNSSGTFLLALFYQGGGATDSFTISDGNGNNFLSSSNTGSDASNNTAITFGEGNLGISVMVTQLTSTTYSMTITPLGGGAAFTMTHGLLANGGGPIGQFVAYDNNAGSGGSNDYFVNSLAIVPEPSSLATMLIVGLGLVRRRHR
jgi:hypothetical protein